MRHRTNRREFVIIGLGRFGASLARRLTELGHTVLAIDKDIRLVQDLSDELAQSVALDATDEDALRSVGVEEFDTAVVAIGSDFEASLLVTVLLKELGLRRVICKALTRRQQQILLRVGADEVVLPEHDAGERLARRLASPLLMESFELEPGVDISEIHVPDRFAGKSLTELDLPGRLGLRVLLIRGKRLRPAPDAEEVLEAGDVLVVVGPDESVRRLETWEP